MHDDPLPPVGPAARDVAALARSAVAMLDGAAVAMERLAALSGEPLSSDLRRHADAIAAVRARFAGKPARPAPGLGGADC